MMPFWADGEERLSLVNSPLSSTATETLPGADGFLTQRHHQIPPDDWEQNSFTADSFSLLLEQASQKPATPVCGH